MQDTTLKSKVKNFWNNHPLFSYELSDLKSSLSQKIFDDIDYIKLNDIERFSMPFWEFDQHADQKVLDIGCGPGFLVRNYSRGKAKIIGLDMSEKSAYITHHSLKLYGLPGIVVVGDAENLPFKKDSFDFISSCGALHHTPDTEKTFTEIKNVLKNKKTALIALYYKNVLLNQWLFPWILKTMKLLKVTPPGRSSMTQVNTIEEFVRTYDGDQNPVGKAYNKIEYRSLVKNFKLLKEEVHFFPKRFFPFHQWLPQFVHYLCDRYFGTMIYLKILKNQ